MAYGQAGIFALGTVAHGFFEFEVRAGKTASDLVRAIGAYRQPRMTTSGANVVIGYRPSLWAKAGALPEDVRDFGEPLRGAGGYTMPATQADAFVWIASATYDTVFDLGHGLLKSVDAVVRLSREFSGWNYRHDRDLTGFEDGTENPTLDLARSVALVDDGRPGEGGSVLLFQQWRHETAAWEALGDERQEDVIGRTKVDSVEFEGDRMPHDSHVSRTKFVVDGEERKIFRRNVPYGDVSSHGTLFVGFAGEQRRLQAMLEQMAGAEGGPRDALTRFATPLTGAYYFCPSVEALAEFEPTEDE